MFHIEDLSALLLFFKRNTPLTILDTGGRLDATLVAAARDADVLLLVTTSEMPSLRNSAKLLASFGRLGVARERVAVVVNHARQVPGFDIASVSRTLGMDPIAVLPFDKRAAARATAEGKPVGAEGGKLGGAIEELAQTVIERLDSPHLGGRASGAQAVKPPGRLRRAFAR